MLIELAPRLAAHLAPGGTLLASGIIDRARRRGGRRRWRPPDCSRAERRVDGEWVSLRMVDARDAASVLRGAGRHARRALPAARVDRAPGEPRPAVCRTASGWCCLTAPARRPPFAWHDGACVVESRGARRRRAGASAGHLAGAAAWRPPGAGHPARHRDRHRRVPAVRVGAVRGAGAVAAAAGAAAGRGPRGGGAVGARRGAAGRRAGAAARARWRRHRSCCSSGTTGSGWPRWIPPASLVIGPEGGFTPDEVAAAEQAGVTVAGLGPRILRSETVAVAAAAVVLSRSGDFA